MHCNDAPGAIARLDDMGIAPFLISSSVILACAQRLMRRICSHCKEPVTYPAKMYQDLSIDPSIFDGVTLYRGRGCDRCKGSGYKGRLGIYQVMPITETINRMILEGGNVIQIGEQARREGVSNLRESGLKKVKAGITSLEEIEKRVGAAWRRGRGRSIRGGRGAWRRCSRPGRR